jgi:hypothetical protein
MKTYKEFMQESSLSRIKSKSDKGGMAILSGSRGDKSKKENQARAKQFVVKVYQVLQRSLDLM